MNRYYIEKINNKKWRGKWKDIVVERKSPGQVIIAVMELIKEIFIKNNK